MQAIETLNIKIGDRAFNSINKYAHAIFLSARALLRLVLLLRERKESGRAPPMLSNGGRLQKLARQDSEDLREAVKKRFITPER